MKKIIVALFIAAFSFLSVEAHTLIVKVKPKAPKCKVYQPAIKAGFVWIPGTWVIKNGRYQWRDGRCVKARKGYVWKKGHWKRVRGGWAYKPGRWKRC